MAPECSFNGAGNWDCHMYMCEYVDSWACHLPFNQAININYDTRSRTHFPLATHIVYFMHLARVKSIFATTAPEIQFRFPFFRGFHFTFCQRQYAQLISPQAIGGIVINATDGGVPGGCVWSHQPSNTHIWQSI